MRFTDKNSNNDIIKAKHVEGDVFIGNKYGINAEEHKKAIDKAAEDINANTYKAISRQEEEKIAKLRANLHEAVQKEYGNNDEVKKLCLKIKEYIPDDLQANFYLTAISGTSAEINAMLRSVNPEEEYVEDIISFLLNPLDTDCALHISYLIERAFKHGENIDPRYEKYMTMLEENQRLADLGVYDETLPRHVFLAYRSTDIEKAIELCDYLESNGITCFMSQRNLKHGRGAKNLYDERLKRAIDNCTVLVFVSSRQSRTTGDARYKELVYIRQKDRSSAPAEYSHNYAKMPKKYKMPRVEYLIEARSGKPNEMFIKEFFDGYQWRESPEAVYDAVCEYLDNWEIAETETGVTSIPQAKVKYCKNCGEENLLSAEVCSKKGCGCEEFVDTYKEYLEYEKAKKEREIEEERRKFEEAKKAEEERLAALEADLATTKANLKSNVEKEIRDAEKARKAEDRRIKRAESREKTAEALKKIFTYPFLGIWFVAKYTGTGIGKALSYVFNPKGERIFVFAIVLFLSLLGLGLFNLIFPLTNHVAFPSHNGTAWITTCIVFFVLALISFIMSIIRAFLGGDKDFGGVSVLVSVIGLILIAVFMLIGGLRNTMFGWAIAFSVVGFIAAAVGFGIISACEPDADVQIAMLLLVAAVYTLGLTLCGGLYAIQNKPEVYDENIFYQLRDDNTLTVYADKYETEVLEIPAAIDGYTVTSVEKPMRGGSNTVLKTVILPDTLLYIEDGAFENCEALSAITIPDSVVEIGDKAFKNCGLLEIEIPDSVENIGENVFQNCSKLTSVRLPDNLTEIPEKAFKGCSALKDIVLPDGLTKINPNAFENCISLTKIIIPESAKPSSYVFKGCVNLTIYCRIENVSGWDAFWNWGSEWNGGRPVEWGYKEEN